MKKENPFDELIGSVRFMWRHRKGNEVIGNIMDVFDNLDFTTKDKRKPIIASKRKTDYGWYLVINLPPGISYGDVLAKREYFQDATHSWINLSWNNAVHMEIQCGSLPTQADYNFNPSLYKMELPVPVGFSQKGLEVFDLVDSPHLLVAGVPGYGKSNLLHVIIHSLLPRAYICIIDLKRLEFAYLSQHAALTKNEKDALLLLQLLNQEMEKRIDILLNADVLKIQDYQNEMPYIVLVIDEVAEIRNDDLIDLVDRIVRLARAVGISVVAATQRPSKKVKLFQDDVRDMFLARICYQMADENSSRIVLDNGLAANLPGIKGRGIFKYGLIEREVQTMFLPHAKAKQLILNQPSRKMEVAYEQPQARLRPR